MEYSLEQIDPDNPHPIIIRLDGNEVIVGRKTVVSLSSHSLVSRRHASFHNINGEWHVKDLGSLNCLYVNAQRVENKDGLRKLRVGDTIGFGVPVYLSSIKDGFICVLKSKLSIKKEDINESDVLVVEKNKTVSGICENEEESKKCLSPKFFSSCQNENINLSSTLPKISLNHLDSKTGLPKNCIFNDNRSVLPKSLSLSSIGFNVRNDNCNDTTEISEPTVALPKIYNSLLQFEETVHNFVAHNTKHLNTKINLNLLENKVIKCESDERIFVPPNSDGKKLNKINIKDLSETYRNSKLNSLSFNTSKKQKSETCFDSVLQKKVIKCPPNIGSVHLLPISGEKRAKIQNDVSSDAYLNSHSNDDILSNTSKKLPFNFARGKIPVFQNEISSNACFISISNNDLQLPESPKVNRRLSNSPEKETDIAVIQDKIFSNACFTSISNNDILITESPKVNEKLSSSAEKDIALIQDEVSSNACFISISSKDVLLSESPKVNKELSNSVENGIAVIQDELSSNACFTSISNNDILITESHKVNKKLSSSAEKDIALIQDEVSSNACFISISSNDILLSESPMINSELSNSVENGIAVIQDELPSNARFTSISNNDILITESPEVNEKQSSSAEKDIALIHEVSSNACFTPISNTEVQISNSSNFRKESALSFTGETTSVIQDEVSFNTCCTSSDVLIVKSPKNIEKLTEKKNAKLQIGFSPVLCFNSISDTILAVNNDKANEKLSSFSTVKITALQNKFSSDTSIDFISNTNSLNVNKELYTTFTPEKIKVNLNEVSSDTGFSYISSIDTSISNSSKLNEDLPLNVSGDDVKIVQCEVSSDTGFSSISSIDTSIGNSSKIDEDLPLNVSGDDIKIVREVSSHTGFSSVSTIDASISNSSKINEGLPLNVSGDDIKIVQCKVSSDTGFSFVSNIDTLITNSPKITKNLPLNVSKDKIKLDHSEISSDIGFSSVANTDLFIANSLVVNEDLPLSACKDKIEGIQNHLSLNTVFSSVSIIDANVNEDFHLSDSSNNICKVHSSSCDKRFNTSPNANFSNLHSDSTGFNNNEKVSSVSALLERNCDKNVNATNVAECSCLEMNSLKCCCAPLKNIINFVIDFSYDSTYNNFFNDRLLTELISDQSKSTEASVTIPGTKCKKKCKHFTSIETKTEIAKITVIPCNQDTINKSISDQSKLSEKSAKRANASCKKKCKGLKSVEVNTKVAEKNRNVISCNETIVDISSDKSKMTKTSVKKHKSGNRKKSNISKLSGTKNKNLKINQSSQKNEKCENPPSPNILKASELQKGIDAYDSSIIGIDAYDSSLKGIDAYDSLIKGINDDSSIKIINVNDSSMKGINAYDDSVSDLPNEFIDTAKLQTVIKTEVSYITDISNELIGSPRQQTCVISEVFSITEPPSEITETTLLGSAVKSEIPSINFPNDISTNNPFFDSTKCDLALSSYKNQIYPPNSLEIKCENKNPESSLSCALVVRDFVQDKLYDNETESLSETCLSSIRDKSCYYEAYNLKKCSVLLERLDLKQKCYEEISVKNIHDPSYLIKKCTVLLTRCDSKEFKLPSDVKATFQNDSKLLSLVSGNGTLNLVVSGKCKNFEKERKKKVSSATLEKRLDESGQNKCSTHFSSPKANNSVRVKGLTLSGDDSASKRKLGKTVQKESPILSTDGAAIEKRLKKTVQREHFSLVAKAVEKISLSSKRKANKSYKRNDIYKPIRKGNAKTQQMGITHTHASVGLNSSTLVLSNKSVGQPSAYGENNSYFAKIPLSKQKKSSALSKLNKQANTASQYHNSYIFKRKCLKGKQSFSNYIVKKKKKASKVRLNFAENLFALVYSFQRQSDQFSSADGASRETEVYNNGSAQKTTLKSKRKNSYPKRANRFSSRMNFLLDLPTIQTPKSTCQKDIVNKGSNFYKSFTNLLSDNSSTRLPSSCTVSKSPIVECKKTVPNKSSFPIYQQYNSTKMNNSFINFQNNVTKYPSRSTQDWLEQEFSNDSYSSSCQSSSSEVLIMDNLDMDNDCIYGFDLGPVKKNNGIIIPCNSEAINAPAKNHYEFSHKYNSLTCIQKIMEWNPRWLNEVQDFFPIVANRFGHLDLTFDHFDTYFAAFSSVIVLDIWQYMLLKCSEHRSTNEISRDFYCVTTFCIDKHDMVELQCCSYVTDSQSYTPSEGTVVFLDIFDKEREINTRVFGYISRFKALELKDKQSRSLSIVSKAKKWDFNIYVKKEICLENQILLARGICNIKGHLQLADALCTFQFSPFKNIVLQLKEENFLLCQHSPDITSAEYINRMKEEIMNFYSPLKVLLCHGAPGTGKTHSVLQLLQKLLFFNTFKLKILVTAPSDSALDEIGLRIIELNERHTWKCKSLNVIRIGTTKTVHQKLQAYVLEEMVARMCKNHCRKDLPSEEKLNCLEAEINALYQNLGNAASFKKVDRFLALTHQIKSMAGYKLKSHKSFVNFNQTKLSSEKELDCLASEINVLRQELGTASSFEKVDKILSLIEEHKLMRDQYEKKLQEASKAACLSACSGSVCSHLYCCMHRACKQYRVNLLEECDIVLTTLDDSIKSVVNLMSTQNVAVPFTCCIVDNASDCTELELLQCLTIGINKLILFGDVLPNTPKIAQKSKCDLKRSMFERFYSFFNKFNLESPIFTLKKQFRMHSEICRFPSVYFYNNTLEITPEVDDRYKLSPLKPYFVLDVISDQYIGSLDESEADQLALTYLCSIIKQATSSANIGVISTKSRVPIYNACLFQNDFCREVEVNTVDHFLSKEKDIVIIPCVKSNDSNELEDFASDYSKTKLALTRARQSLIIYGNISSLDHHKHWKALRDDAISRNLYTSISSLFHMPLMLNEIIFKPGV